MQEGRGALVPALGVHVSPDLAALGPALQPVRISVLSCVLARIMAHTDNLTRYRVCQLAPRWQSIHKGLLPAGPFGLLCELRVSSLYAKNPEGPQVRLTGPKATRHCCTAPARL